MVESYSLEQCRALDAADPLASVRDRFAPPVEGRIHLDANSIGAMPASVPDRLRHLTQEVWVGKRRRAWGEEPWLDRPRQIGAALAPMLGADGDDVLATDNTTVNLFKLLDYAWRIRHGGRVILTEAGNFPTDLYVLQGLANVVADPPEIRAVADRANLIDAIGPDTAIVYLSHVDYRSSDRWDMADINGRARQAGALTVWDLSHAAGAIPIDLMGRDSGQAADFAVTCGYKYLCGGPGGPSLLWVHPDHGQAAWPTICGWMGHADTFAFDAGYAPRGDIGRHAAGTPSVIANEVFWAAAEVWAAVDPADVWAKHRSLSALAIGAVEQQCARHGVTIASPRDYDRQGGHIALSHPAAGPLCEALVEAGVVTSFRKPGSLRFGLGPLYLSHEDVWIAVKRLAAILDEGRWREDRFQTVAV